MSMPRLARMVRPIWAGLAVFLAGSAIQAQTIQFASFSQMPNDTSKAFTDANNGLSGTSAMAGFSQAPNLIVSFSFTGISGMTTSPFTALVTMGGTTTAPVSQTVIPGLGTMDTEVISSSISFRDVATGKNLLTATFSGTLTGFDGGSSATLMSSSVTYTSDFLDFSGTVSRALTFQLNPSNAPLTVASNGLFNTFSGTGSGQFSSNPIPFAPPVPEPASLAMVGMGLVLPVVVVRLRRRGAAPAA